MNPLLLAEIEGERSLQKAKWGTAFDDKNTLNDWATYIVSYVARAAKMGLDGPNVRLALVKVAALAIAAIEAYDRNNGFPKRHYD